MNSLLIATALLGARLTFAQCPGRQCPLPVNYTAAAAAEIARYNDPAQAWTGVYVQDDERCERIVEGGLRKWRVRPAFDLTWAIDSQRQPWPWSAKNADGSWKAQQSIVTNLPAPPVPRDDPEPEPEPEPEPAPVPADGIPWTWILGGVALFYLWNRYGTWLKQNWLLVALAAAGVWYSWPSSEAAPAAVSRPYVLVVGESREQTTKIAKVAYSKSVRDYVDKKNGEIRVIDDDVTDESGKTPPELADLIKVAKKNGALPQAVMCTSGRKVLGTKKLPTTPQAFLSVLRGYYGT